MVKAQHGSVQHGSFQHGYEATNVSGTATAEVAARGDASGSLSVSGTATVDVDGSATAAVQFVAAGSATVDVDASGRATSPVSASGAATIDVAASGSAQSGFSASGSATIDVAASGNALVVIRPVRVGDIVADEIVDQPVPSQTLGETITLQLLFDDRQPAEGYTVPAPVEDRYQDARDYLKSASDAAIDSGTDDTGNPWFRERLPNNAAVTTLVGQLKTNEILDIDLENSYVVIEDVTDQSNSAYDHKRVDVTVRTLGYESDFADLAAAREATEVTLGWIIESTAADALTDEAPPTLTRGETVTLPLRFDDLTTGAYEDIRDYLAYQAVDFGTDSEGIPFYRDQTPDQSPVTDSVVEIDPEQSAPGFESFWGVITGGGDVGEPRPDEREIELEVGVLGTTSEYGTQSALEDELAVTLGWLVGGNVADALTDDAPPTLTRGETITRTFRFGDLSNFAYQDLRDLLDYPSVSTWTTDTGIPRFRERLPDIAPTDSAVVKVEPETENGLPPEPGFEGFWALVTGGDDAGPPRPDERQLDLELTVLGTLSEYADETALRNALESDPVGGT